MSEGCNRLIRDGAHPVFGGADLLEELSLVIGPPATVTDVEHGIPAEGVPVSDLPDIWSLTITETLVKLGRLELEGKVKRLGEYVVPS
jgi:predicted Rossmann fold nucleotide-binding protein DprA/Smf involved in DNA uptake